MKRILAFALMLCMVLSLAACGSSASSTATEAPAAEATEAPAEETAAAETTAAAEYTLGMGVSLSTDSSDTGNAQVDATVAAVVQDADGKIVACRLDVAQSKMAVEDGAVDTAATFSTKMELGDDYGMVAYGNAIAEWDAQAKAFEEYVVGKTADEVEAIETATNDSGHNVAVDETLLAGCTIDITSFKAAVVKACSELNTATFTADSFTLGVAAKTDASESTAATADEDGTVKMYTDYAAVALDADGKILAAVTDASQPKITISAAGEIVSADFGGTKMELGSDYGMVAYGNAIAEWNDQAKAFAAYTVGKTADEVLAIETVTNDEGHAVSTDETLLASCTMSIDGMMAVIAQAAEYAR